MKIRVLPSALKHGLYEKEIRYAWASPVRCRQRNGTDDPPIWIMIGALPNGKMAELIAFQDSSGVWCVFHAMTPPTTKFIKELGLERGGHEGD